MAEWSEARVCGRSLAGVAGSNPTGGMDVRVELHIKDKRHSQDNAEGGGTGLFQKVDGLRIYQLTRPNITEGLNRGQYRCEKLLLASLLNITYLSCLRLYIACFNMSEDSEPDCIHRKIKRHILKKGL